MRGIRRNFDTVTVPHLIQEVTKSRQGRDTDLNGETPDLSAVCAVSVSKTASQTW